MNRLLAVLLCTLIYGCTANPIETTRVPVKLPGWNGKELDLGKGRGTITEYYPADESADSWTQLATVQFLEGNRDSARSAMEGLRARMTERQDSGASVTWEVITEDATSVTYEWSISGSPEHPDQVELARLLQGNDGLHRVAFTKKGASFTPAERSKWLAALAGAQVIKGDELVVMNEG